VRVVFVGPFPWPSPQGSQAYLAGQARALAARGHDVRVVVYGAGRGGHLPGVELVRAAGIPGGDFRGGGLHWSRPLHDLALAAALRRTLKERPADLLHAHNVEGPLVATLARTGLPIVYDLHTSMAEELGDHLGRGRRFGPPLGGLLDRLASSASDGGCAISARAHGLLRAAGLPTVQVGPGVDPSELEARPGARDRFGPGPWVVYTGNLDAYQDLPLLYAAMAQVPARLLIVTASDAPVPAGPTVVRSTDWRDAIDALSVADLAVIPRRRCAGFPVKLLNQLGMGVPTVMIEGADQPLPGVVACPPDQLAPTLRTLLQDPARRDRLAASAREAIRARWTWSAKAELLEQLYARVTA
jgi:glycosyltransferase involved in cell wall biosynthesis